MKSKFTAADVCASIHDLRCLIGMRITNVYDLDSKTYLLKLHKPNAKEFILFESGVRIHCTNHNWAKSQVPSGFSMKFRKHINQKRLTHVSQVGNDRIVDLTFGDEERACHVIVELYDRGNVVLTDSDYRILNVLRARTDHDRDVRFSVKEIYPLHVAQQDTFLPSLENIALFLNSAKQDDLIRRALVRHVPFSGQLLEHGLITVGLPANAKIKDLGEVQKGTLKLMEALQACESVAKQVREEPSKGYVTYNKLARADGTEVEIYEEYNPICFAQFTLPDSKFFLKEFERFSDSVDSFYSMLESQKVDHRTAHVENEAIKKLNNVKKDHERRLRALEEVQNTQEKRAYLLQSNKELVDACLLIVRQCLANKMRWDEIDKVIENAAAKGNAYAKIFVRLKLADNAVVLRLTDPYANLEESTENDDSSNETEIQSKQEKKHEKSAEKGMDVEVDIDLSADQNCRQYFSERKAAAIKQKKTLQASSIAMKNAQKQTEKKVKQVRTNTSLARTRKTMWFEKFYWCVSSEGYLILGGRDAQQNEMLVKRYLRPGDVYVHADLHGASSVVVRNKNRDSEIPPMTLNEAGSIAISFSAAWEAKVVVNAWWVYDHQVSRTAPTGEYLPTGSFMVRGKKNFLPSGQLQLGFGLMFRLDDESIERHLAERNAKLENLKDTVSTHVDETSSTLTEANSIELDEDNEQDVELQDNNDDDTDDNDNEYPDVEVNLNAKNLQSNSTNQQIGNDDYTLIKLGREQKPMDERQKWLDSKRAEVKQAEEKELKKAKKKNAPLTKRQKHKLEKIRKKYANQDEEERDLRMRLMGTQVSSLLSNFVLRNEKKAGVEPTNANIAEICTEEKTIDENNVEDNKPTTMSDEQANTELAIDEEQQQENEQKKDVDEEEEEDVELLDNLDSEQAVVETLTALPYPEDRFLFLVAVCAPYTAMQKFKYKVKITPGTGKRGKAVKMALALFQTDKSATPAELSLIRALTADPSVVQQLPGHVRVSAPNILRTKNC